MADGGVDVYPVGLLADLLFFVRTVRRAPEHTGEAWSKLWRGFRLSWRRRSYWNGYLAEPTTTHAWRRCGHAWSRRRALRDLDRHLADVVASALDDPAALRDGES